MQNIAPEMEKTYLDAFGRGDVRLDCTSISCAGLMGSNRRRMLKLYNSERWSELALIVIKVRFSEDLTYYYLGRSAEGIGKPNAAIIYYKLALQSFKCNGVINNCDGFSFPQDIRVRLSNIAAEKPLATQQSTEITSSSIVSQPAKIAQAPSSEAPQEKTPQEIQSSMKSKTSDQGKINIFKKGGVYHTSVTLNEVLTIDFIIDSGASDVSISPDVALTLIKTNTIRSQDWLPGRYYKFANGSTAKSVRFKLRTLKLGNKTLRDVTCSISKSIDAPMLLGQSALEKLGGYSIDYDKMVITFNVNKNRTAIDDYSYTSGQSKTNRDRCLTCLKYVIEKNKIARIASRSHDSCRTSDIIQENLHAIDTCEDLCRDEQEFMDLLRKIKKPLLKLFESYDWLCKRGK
ncbi:MAG: retropepsin-like aspartic protease family protein [Smithellaceae bacterium]